MSVRRPRVKAVANLALRRKTTTDKLKPEKVINSENLGNQSSEIEHSNLDKSTIDNENSLYYNNLDISKLLNVPSDEFNQSSKSILLNNTSESVQLHDSNRESNINEDFIFDSNLKNQTQQDDSIFKSPPNYSHNRNNTTSYPQTKSVFADIVAIPINDSLHKDEIKCPLSPTKVRQRIKPTPFFGHRRNSISNRDDPDDSPKRQRHLSTSSTSSSNNVYAKPLVINRVRTESACSNASDNSIIRELPSKLRRVQRSDESNRLNELRRGFRNRFPNLNPDKAKLTMLDMIYYNPVTNPMKNALIKEEKIKSTASSVHSFPQQKPKSIHTMSIDKREEVSLPVPQLKIGPNGEIIIDEKSLVIETTCEKEARETLANADIVYDDEFSGCQGFYKRQRRTKDWSASETIKFYRCLHTIGTDFSMMLSLFPTRTRRDLKLKFKKEEKYNPDLINKALLNPKVFNIDELESDLQIEEENAKKLLEEEKKLKEKRMQERSKVLKKLKYSIPQRHLSKSVRSLTDGDFVYEQEELTSAKRPRRSRKQQTPSLSQIQDTIEESKPNENVNSSANIDNENTYVPNLTTEFLNNITTDFSDDTTSNSIILPSYQELRSDTSNLFNTIENNSGKNYFTNISNKQMNNFTNTANTTNHKDQIVTIENYNKVIEIELPNTNNYISNDSRFDIVELSSSTNDTHDLYSYTKPSYDNTQTEEDIRNSVEIINERNNYEIIDVEDSIETNTNRKTPSDLDIFSLNMNNLVAVASQDPKNPDQIIHEIYVMSPTTGELSEKPLDIPDELVKAIAAEVDN